MRLNSSEATRAGPQPNLTLEGEIWTHRRHRPREEVAVCTLRSEASEETNPGVPAVAQWIKNLTAAAQVAVETRVQSLAQHSGLKYPAMLQLQLRLNPWPRNFHKPWGWALKKEAEETTPAELCSLRN